MGDHLKNFRDGWMSGDMDKMLGACADDFVCDDPFYGRASKAEFADFYSRLPDVDDLVFSDETAREANGEETAWWWWAFRAPGATEWTQEGAALAKAGPDGIHSLRTAYYKR